MNNVKFENNKDKSYLKRVYKETYLNNLMSILATLADKYQITKPVITGIKLGYDYENIDIYLQSKDYEVKKYVVTINVREQKMIVRRINRKTYECFDIAEGKCFLTRKGYENKDQKVRVEKVYPNNSDGFQVLANNNLVSRKYIYNYSTISDKFVIILVLPESLAFNEDMFLSSLCMNQEKVEEPVDLYTILRGIFRTSNLQITVRNKRTGEMITVRNAKLINYIENKTEGELEYTINYQNGNCSITHKVLEPNTNRDIKEIMGKINR